MKTKKLYLYYNQPCGAEAVAARSHIIVVEQEPHRNDAAPQNLS
jgi:hypothetical protein